MNNPPMAKAASIMNELLIAETKELEKYIQGKVAEGEGSRAEERASCYFGHSHHLASEVRAGRLKPEKACAISIHKRLVHRAPPDKDRA
jgi:hypothetical protein